MDMKELYKLSDRLIAQGENSGRTGYYCQISGCCRDADWKLNGEEYCHEHFKEEALAILKRENDERLI